MARSKKEQNSNEINDVLLSLQDSLIKEFGEGSASPLSSSDSLSKIGDSISSRSIVIDAILRGGRKNANASLFPCGRQVELSGLNNSGKTTLCAQVAAEVQSRGGIAITIDTEERIDEDYWTSLGVDCSKVLRLQAHTLEEVFNKQESLLRNLVEKAPETMGVMIWDSVGGTSSDEIITFDAKSKETFMDKAKQAYGRDAKTIGLGLKGLNGLISRSNICYMYTNHLYTKMNAGHGDQYETYGGLKAKFMATVRLRLQKIGSISVDDDTDNKLTTGVRVKVKALKNSMGPHLLEKESVILGGKGFSNEYTVLEYGKKLGLVSTAGAWSTANIAGEEVKFQGWNGFMDKVVTHPKYVELLKQVAEAL